MTAEALHLPAPARPASVASHMFAAALILATLLPLAAIAIASFHPVMVSSAAFLVALASTHVFATGYLLTDAEVRRFVRTHPVKMIAIPVLMLTGGTLVLGRPGSGLFVGSVLVFFLYQTWHFGAQNIGVATFVSLSDRGRPLAATEKRLIRAGIVIGMLGVLKAMTPGFMIGAEHMPLAAPVAAAIELAYRLGSLAAPVLAAVAAGLMVQAWRAQHRLYGIAIFLSVTFLFPMYLSGDFALGFLSFVTAHGIQYLVFLGTHSLGPRPAGAPKPRARIAWLAAPAALLAAMLAARLIWVGAPVLQPSGLPLFGTAIVLSLTLAHFWVDQFLWRTKDRSRASWMKARFGYVLG